MYVWLFLLMDLLVFDVVLVVVGVMFADITLVDVFMVVIVENVVAVTFVVILLWLL